MWNKIALSIFRIVLLITLIIGIFIISVYFGAFGRIHNRQELLNIKNATASLVLSNDGELIGKFFSENRINVSSYQIPPFLKDALIATEDIRFYKHKGVDSRSVFRVFFKTILLNKPGSGGGSTITQQLAKNLFGRKNYGLLTIFVNKTKETFLALRLEKVFTKDELLTLYLNTVPFGEDLFGIESASLRYFNKKVESLSIEESAVLIGMLKANTSYNPRLYPEKAVSRRNIVLRQMYKYHYLESFETDSLCRLPLKLDYSNIEIEKPYGYFLVQVRKEAEHILQGLSQDNGKIWNIEDDGLIITTSLDISLQNHAIEAFRNHLSVMQKRLEAQYKTTAGKRLLEEITESELKRLSLSDRANDVIVQKIFDWEGSYTGSLSVRDSLKQALVLLHAGLLAINPSSGAIRAWVGGIDFNSQPFDQIQARRQLASTFKPILYAAAIEEGIDPCFYLDNDSIVLEAHDNWSPKNFDHSYGGKYSLAGALVRSMNIPTFNLFLHLGYDKLQSLWSRMGFSFHLNNTPSLALGTAEANIQELAIAYSVFANGGYKVNPRSLVSIKTSDGEIIYQNDFNEIPYQVLSQRTSQIITAILERAIREGTGATMRSIYGVYLPFAGKTGTSQDYADAWFAAFNPKLVMVSRVGASSPAIHFNSGSNGTGSALALPLVALTLRNVQSDKELIKQMVAPFSDLPDELQGTLDCPDFMEGTILDKFMDMFKRDGIPYEERLKRFERKKRPLLERIFKRR